MRKLFFFLVLLLISYALVSKITPSTSSAQETPRVSGPQDTLDATDNYLPLIMAPLSTSPPVGVKGWSTVAGNLERTSWTDEEVTGNLQVEWYRPIEAYIPQNVQIITSNGILYIATARGLYALHAISGDIIWRFDTEMPLGNSPTVADGIVYVGGYDRKLHALNAANGTHLWSYDGANAGYDTNPLVVDGKVILGNRDGRMYAIGAHGTANQGQLLWSYQTGGPIHLSAAYKDSVVYFAANDNYAYALNADNGALIWKSGRLPGQQYQSYWPVIYQDKVIFAVANGYRRNIAPGIHSADSQSAHYRDLQLTDIFPGVPEGTTLGPLLPAQPWSHGYPIVDASRVTEYLEDNPNPQTHQHKPWRRVFAVLNRSNGSEYTYDSDGDGHPEYIPATWWGTDSGNRFPPIVGADNMLYFDSLYKCCSNSKGQVMGWLMGTQYVSILHGTGATAEPQALSIGGNIIYRNLCCDRVGDWFNMTDPDHRGQLWSYNLETLAPDYDPMWTILPGWPRHQGWYKGNSNSANAAYHNHGDQNPLVPYEGRVYTHRSNTIVAFGTGSGPGLLPSLDINNVTDNVAPITQGELIGRLQNEVQKMIDAGHLRPGYYNPGQMGQVELVTYFENPGDTLYALSLAYPYLPSGMQSDLAAYLEGEFQAYFDSTMYARTGWADGAPREDMDLPPEVEADLANFPPRTTAGSRFMWLYPPHNLYAMWQYAATIPGVDINNVYDLAKSKIEVPIDPPDHIDPLERFDERPYELNAYIAGYIGFLNLQELAGMSGVDAQLRADVTAELNQLKQLRVDLFTKEPYWVDTKFHKKHLDIARNFIWLTPEVGELLRVNRLTEAQEAVDEYEYIAPYWFVSRYEAVMDEGVMSNLYNYNALFLAKAYILQESRSELVKYLDTPAFARGDLLYMLNLITAIEAPAN